MLFKSRLALASGLTEDDALRLLSQKHRSYVL